MYDLDILTQPRAMTIRCLAGMASGSSANGLESEGSPSAMTEHQQPRVYERGQMVNTIPVCDKKRPSDGLGGAPLEKASF